MRAAGSTEARRLLELPRRGARITKLLLVGVMWGRRATELVGWLLRRRLLLLLLLLLLLMGRSLLVSFGGL
jgi:hypothetical protein